MKASRSGRYLVCITFILLGLTLGWMTRSLMAAASGHVTVTSLSPDDQFQAVLAERSSFIDRNFVVRLGPPGTDTSKFETIFTSPDEGRPIGSERFIWSKDGTCLLLVGRHFFVEGSTRTQTGEDLYLLYHLPAKRLWCNARQSNAERFGFRELLAIEFTEPVSEAKPDKLSQR